MARFYPSGSGSGGLDPDELTATAADVLKGMKAGVKGNDEPVTGTLELTGNTSPSQVLSGCTFYTTNPKSKLTGTMVDRGNWTESVGMNGKTTIPGGKHGGSGYINGPSITDRGAGGTTLNCGGSYTISQGYYNGSGKVTANSLASQTSANAGASQILSGYTAWVNGNKITGNVTVQSILSFSAAVYSSTAIVFSWKNPAKGAFSGVIIVGKTGSHPTSISDGTRWYKGSGNNSSANGTSSATVSGLAAGTTYYFRAFSYAVREGDEWIHTTSYTSSATTTKGQQEFKGNGTFTVPAGVRSIDIFCVGGGGGVSQSSSNRMAGAGGGYTKTYKNISVTPGQVLSVEIGNGGDGVSGGTTSVGSYSAKGGNSGSSRCGGAGGSGGGGSTSSDSEYGGNGGSDGSDGGIGGFWDGAGKGQGTTTRAFGESSGTLFSGGGGGGAYGSYSWSYAGEAGAGGGGIGGNDKGSPGNGTVNTGGGAGGFGTWGNSKKTSGGSGIAIIRWGY